MRWLKSVFKILVCSLVFLSILLIPNNSLSSTNLVKERIEFTKALQILMLYKPLPYNVVFPELDYELALGEVKRNCEVDGGHPRSAHNVGLAAHLIVYTPDYQWPHPESEVIYRILHIVWESYGGAPLIEGDLNHFSFEWEGVR